jgi:hypothetical protein
MVETMNASKILPMTQVQVGARVSWMDAANPYREGVVVDIPAGEQERTFGAGDFSHPSARLVVVFSDLTLHRVAECTIDGKAWRWIDGPAMSAEACAELHALALKARDDKAAETDRKRREAAEAEKAWKTRFGEIQPAWAKGVIVAVEDIDDCDLHTDYHNHKHGRRVVLAWSKSGRNSFREMRKAAATFEPTEHLGPGKDKWRVILSWDHDDTDADAKAGSFIQSHQHYFKGSGVTCCGSWYESAPEKDGHGVPVFSTEADADAWIAKQPERAGVYWRKECESSEHRENWSMGQGYFLKAGYRDGSGWRIEKHPLKYGVPSIFPADVSRVEIQAEKGSQS